jgi:hypothetical protein
MTIENNPLRQFFRRPAIYIRLPSGGRQYKPGIVSLPESGELPVYPMTAIDEITLRTPDALYNGSAVADVIRSCIPSITDPWKINSVDLDALLIAIRTASDGNDQEIKSTCPACGEESTYGVNLVGLLPTINYKSYEQELVIGDLTLKMRPLEYIDVNAINIRQFETQKIISQANMVQNESDKTEKMKEVLMLITDATNQALAVSIEYIKTPTAYVDQTDYILEFLQNCDKKTYDLIKEHSMKVKNDSEMKPMKIRCIHCQHEYQQEINLNMSDFFG